MPPTFDGPKVRAAALVRNALAELVVTVTAPVLAAVIGVPTVPISPDPLVRFMVVPADRVKAPERVIVPIPLAFKLSVVVVAAPVLAPILMLPLLEVASVTVPDDDCDTVPLIVRPVPPVIEIVPVVAVTVPVVALPRALTVRFRVPRVSVSPELVKSPPLLSWKLVIAGNVDMLRDAAIVSPPVCEVVPMIRVPAVKKVRSEGMTLKVPPEPLTEMDLAPFGSTDMVPLPALSAALREISLAVIVIGELVVDRVPVVPFVKLPVPSVVMVTPVVPVTAWFNVMVPFEPDDVCMFMAAPETALDVVILPLAISVTVPVVVVKLPVVVM